LTKLQRKVVLATFPIASAGDPVSFASPIFLWLFLPATLIGYWTLPARFRNLLLAVVSLLFYMWGAGAFVFLLLACIVVNYTAGVAIGGRTPRWLSPRTVLVGTIVFDVAVLVIWKYAGFASRQFDVLTKTLGLGSSPVLRVALPIGISFYTFHHLSYVVDVYRGTRPPLRKPVTFVTYIAMFPQLIAGPIVRYHEIADQLDDVRAHRLDDFAAGFPRFALGLSKKVIVADTIAPVANAAFSVHGTSLTTATAWIGVLAYTMQIYFDFSGYSDMAIGLGRMFGFRLPENFARPYSASSITDFWRRWHMSLSRWFRDYVYIPLGGNRGSESMTYRNLIIVFALTGLWHGANWTFLFWGLYHGALLIVERVTGWNAGAKTSIVLRRAVTFLLVMIGWVLFRAESIPRALEVLRAMFVPSGLRVADVVDVALTNQRTVTLVLATLVVLLPPSFVLGRVLDADRTPAAHAARFGIMTVGASYAAILVAAGTFSPFLYFRF
jgi:alginate O-acetyltransferase complex protein AlgI